MENYEFHKLCSGVYDETSKTRPRTNFEKVTASLDALVEYRNHHFCCDYCAYDLLSTDEGGCVRDGVICADGLRKWLESEVESE